MLHTPWWLIIVLGTTVTACSTARVLDMPANPDRAAAELEARLLARPGDPEALRDLGALLLRTNQVPRGYELLTQAYDRNEQDPKTHFYLGLASEMMGRSETSLRLYARYADAPRQSPYRSLLHGRHEWLRRELAREEMKNLIDREIELGGRFDGEGQGRMSSEIVAVFPLSYHGSDGRYAPLGRGLAELISVDLAAVPEIRVVERARLQVLIDEMELGRSGYLDPTTTPRTGRLLGAGRLIGGTYGVSRNSLQVDAGVVELGSGGASRQSSYSDALRNLFRLEKELVFALLDELNVQLTPEQRQRIEFIPTENLQAFLAYSRGLQDEDAGNFARAAEMFRRAHRLDPSFEQAATRGEAMDAAASAGGHPDDALTALLSPIAPDALINERLQALNENIGAYVVPGGDSRRPVQEMLLPLPPPPPPARQ